MVRPCFAKVGEAMARGDAEQDRLWSSLMVAAQGGDRAAYTRLLRDCAPFIRSIARRRLSNPDQIEDVVQDVLLVIHRVRQTYDPRRPFTPWLAVIADRRCIDAQRRRARIAAHESDNPRAYETFADPLANQALDAGEAAQAVGRLLAGLSPNQRQALDLVKMKEMSLAEASLASGQSVAALKVGVHRAIKRLRAKLRRAE